MISFKSLKVSNQLTKLLASKGVINPTIVQQKTIPLIYDKRDLIVQSKTGSGKTISFSIPIIDMIKSINRVQVLIITPTRELARQVTEVFKQYSTLNELQIATIYGGVPINKQIDQARRADVVVGTPGRINDLINRKKLNLTYCDFLVIDEVDQLLDMGFIDDVKKIISHLPSQRQGLMFSATVNQRVSSLANQLLHKPKQVILKDKVKPSLMKQEYYHVQHAQKIPLLVKLIKERANGLTLVFSNTKHSTRYIADFLNKNNVNADCLNGDMDQRTREDVLKRFTLGDIGVLVATDVAARGIHVDGINLVFNFDLPRTIDIYTHRVGRTARQGKKGIAITIVTDKTYRRFKEINKANNDLIKKIKIPNLPEVRAPGSKERNIRLHSRAKKQSKSKRRGDVNKRRRRH